MKSSLTNAFFGFSLPVLLVAQCARSADWPRWRGPELNGISHETGWQTQWPVDGPKRLWKVAVGIGFASVSVSNGHAFTTGNVGADTDNVYCLDAATGKQIWKYSYPSPLAPKYYEGGTSATPTVDGDRVYSASRKGDVFCLDSADGHLVWSKNVTKELGEAIPTWGFAGSPLVDGDLVILDTGKAGTAFDKKTGKLAWASGKSESGYATPVPFDAGKDRLLAIAAADSIAVVKAADGASVWNFPWKTDYDINAADPIISDGRLFISSGYDHGCALLDISQAKPSVVWQNKSLRNKFNNAVLWKGHLYSADEGGSLKCVAWDTGKVKWTDDSFGTGGLIIADGKIIGLSEKGELIVADATPDGFKPISRAQVLGGKCWTIPVLANGRIYCRNAKGDLVCLDVAGN